MKINYRILAIFTAVLLFLNVPVCGAADVQTERIDTAVSALAGLNVMHGYEDGSFHTERQVTRMEFVALVLRVMGIDELTAGMGDTMPFPDVDPSSWGAGAVQTAVAMGLINGHDNGMFEPDLPVTVNQAAKIMVNVLGYGVEAEKQSGYPVGYLSTANRLGLMKDLNPGEQAASRGEAALLIYNCLNVPMMEKTNAGSETERYEVKDKTLLGKMDIEIISAVVTGIYGAGMNSTKLRENEIELSGTRYESKVDGAAFFGLKVRAWIKSENDGLNRTVVFLQSRDDDGMIIDAGDIDKTTTSREIKYWEGTNLKTETLNSPLTVIYNGRPLTDAEKGNSAYLQPKNGRLIIAEDEGGGSTVIVWDYETYILTGTNDDTLYDIYGRSIQIPSSANVTVVRGAMAEDIANLKGGDILWVAKSLDGTTLRIEIGGSEISGALEEVSENGGETVYTVDGEEYKLAPCYADALSKGHQKAQKLSPGDYGTFTLDLGGQIAAAYVSEESKVQLYGYLINAERSSGVDGVLNLQVMTQDNRFITIPLKKDGKIRFGRTENGSYITSRTDSGAIWNTISTEYAVKKQLIKYETDESGSIKALYLSGSNAGKDALSMDAPQQKMTYAGGVLNQKYFLKPDTPVFYVPNAGRYKEQFYASTAADFFANRTEHTVIVYDIDNLYAGAVVVVTNNENIYVDSTGLDTYISLTNSPVMLIEKSNIQLNDEGTQYLVISGYVGKKYTQVLVSDTISASSTARADLSPGNLIQYDTNDVVLEKAMTSDYDKVMVTYRKIFDCNLINSEPFQTWNYKNNVNANASIGIAYGVISEYDLPYLTVRLNRNTPSGYETDVEVPMVLSGGTAVLRYGGADKKAELMRIEDLAVGQKVLVRQRYNSTREVIVLE